MNGLPDRRSRNAVPDAVGRWLMVAGAIGSAAFVCSWIIGGAVQPGYSPIRQPISDLAVGPYGVPYRIGGVVTALLKIGFATGLALLTLGWPRTPWRYAATVFLVVAGLGMVTTASFTDAPATVRIHSIATAIGALSRLLAMVSVGIVLLSRKALRGGAVYSLVAAGSTLLLFVAEYAAFVPGSPLASARIGGLMERIFVIELEAWYVLIAIGLYRFARSTGASSAATPRPVLQ